MTTDAATHGGKRKGAGRPLGRKAPAGVVRTTRLSADLDAALREWARRHECAISPAIAELVRRALRLVGR